MNLRQCLIYFIWNIYKLFTAFTSLTFQRNNGLCGHRKNSAFFVTFTAIRLYAFVNLLVLFPHGTQCCFTLLNLIKNQSDKPCWELYSYNDAHTDVKWRSITAAIRFLRCCIVFVDSIVSYSHFKVTPVSVFKVSMLHSCTGSFRFQGRNVFY